MQKHHTSEMSDFRFNCPALLERIHTYVKDGLSAIVTMLRSRKRLLFHSPSISPCDVSCCSSAILDVLLFSPPLFNPKFYFRVVLRTAVDTRVLVFCRATLTSKVEEDIPIFEVLRTMLLFHRLNPRRCRLALDVARRWHQTSLTSLCNMIILAHKK